MQCIGLVPVQLPLEPALALCLGRRKGSSAAFLSPSSLGAGGREWGSHQEGFSIHSSPPFEHEAIFREMLLFSYFLHPDGDYLSVSADISAKCTPAALSPTAPVVQ